MRKYIARLLLSLVLLSINISGYADKACTVEIDAKQAVQGECIELLMNINNNPGIIAAMFNLKYDNSRIKLMSVTDKGLLQGGTFGNDYNSVPYTMLWNSASHKNFKDDGVLAVLKFRVLDNAEPGKAFVDLDYNKDDIYNVDLENVPIDVKNGGIEVIESRKNNTDSGNRTSQGKSKDILIKEADDSDKKPTNLIESDSEKGNKSERQIILTIGKKEAQVFGQIKINDVAPKIVNNRTMLPARFVAEALGARVEWNEDKQLVTIIGENEKDEKVTIFITIGGETAEVNGEKIKPEYPAFIENDRTYTPLRFISEKLGGTVDWNEDTREIIITK